MDYNELLIAFGSLMDEKLKPINDRFDGIDKRFDRLESELKAVKVDLKEVKSDVKNVKSEIAQIHLDMENNNDYIVNAMERMATNVDNRLTALESM